MTQGTTPTACIVRLFMLALHVSIATTSSTTAAAFTTLSVAKSVAKSLVLHVRPCDDTTATSSSLPRLRQDPLTRCRMSPSTTGNNEQDDDGNKNKNDADVVKDDVGLLARASWYAVEAFGNVFAAGKSKAPGDDEAITSLQPSSSATTVKLGT